MSRDFLVKKSRIFLLLLLMDKKDFLVKRSRIFLLLLLMEGLVSGWAKIF